ncbi:hypothetical protein QC589_02325 [Halomonas elongata]|uniref:hypothetical protein n=1 Tax=Halomonas elongata TaxID=2746 RepID=UPI00334E9A59
MTELVFHVGQMKTGTTYLQNVLSNNKDFFQKNGWLYPGGKENHQYACYGICGNDIPWVNPRIYGSYKSEGERLIKKIDKFKDEYNILISSEALSSLSQDGIDRFIKATGKPDKVILTIRPLYQALPSAWQQLLKSGINISLEDFFRKLDSERKGRKNWWRTYAYGDAVERWSKVCSVETIVLSPEAPFDLWNEFSTALDLPKGAKLDLAESQKNVSLNMETAKLVRYIIKEGESALSEEGRNKEIKRIINKYLNNFVRPLSGKTRGDTKVLPPRSCQKLIEQWAYEENRKAKRYSSRVFGEIDLLSSYSGEWNAEQNDDLEDSALKEFAYQIIEKYRKS